MDAIPPPSRKTLPFLKEHKIKIVIFVLLHLNFYPATEKCYCLSILKMFIGAAKTTHTESFKNNGSSIVM